jgi:trigger factor
MRDGSDGQGKEQTALCEKAEYDVAKRIVVMTGAHSAPASVIPENVYGVMERQVRKAFLDQFNAPLPEAFLKRWFASRGEKELTPESIEADWNDKYVPSLKWELIEAKLEEISPVEPTNNQIVDYIKDILRRNDQKVEGEKKEETEDRLEKAARSIAADRKNIAQVIDRLYADNLCKLFKDQVKPEVEKVSAKEFAERAKMN